MRLSPTSFVEEIWGNKLESLSNMFKHCEVIYIFYIMSLSPRLFFEIFCTKHLNWILKTAELTESSGWLDERPVKNGEIDSVNPQTRQSDRQADENGRDFWKKQLSLSYNVPMYRSIHSCIWTFHLQLIIQVCLQCIHPSFSCKISGKWLQSYHYCLW